jgi:hypothetical protein
VSLCQKRLRLSWKVDECKPLPVAVVAHRQLGHPGDGVVQPPTRVIQNKQILEFRV